MTWLPCLDGPLVVLHVCEAKRFHDELLSQCLVASQGTIKLDVVLPDCFNDMPGSVGARHGAFDFVQAPLQVTQAGVEPVQGFFETDDMEAHGSTLGRALKVGGLRFLNLRTRYSAVSGLETNRTMKFYRTFRLVQDC